MKRSSRLRIIWVYVEDPDSAARVRQAFEIILRRGQKKPDDETFDNKEYLRNDQGIDSQNH